LPGLVEIYMDGKLKLDEFVTHKFGFEQINQAFECMETGKRFGDLKE
jgi:S-(hydroxymethyl)glutathione dehydrogenase/alcohol dehydrogenase